MSYPKAGHIYTFLYYPTQGPNDVFAAENKPTELTVFWLARVPVRSAGGQGFEPQIRPTFRVSK